MENEVSQPIKLSLQTSPVSSPDKRNSEGVVLRIRPSQVLIDPQPDQPAKKKNSFLMSPGALMRTQSKLDSSLLFK